MERSQAAVILGAVMAGVMLAVSALKLLGRVSTGVLVVATGVCVLAGVAAHVARRREALPWVRVVLDRSLFVSVLVWSGAALHVAEAAPLIAASWACCMAGSALFCVLVALRGASVAQSPSGDGLAAEIARSQEPRWKVGVVLLVAGVAVPHQIVALGLLAAGAIATANRLPWGTTTQHG